MDMGMDVVHIRDGIRKRDGFRWGSCMVLTLKDWGKDEAADGKGGSAMG